MYIRLFLLSLVALSFASARAQKVEFDQLTIDCGKSAFKAPVTAKYEIKNKGLRRLTITDIHPDCGCTAAKITKNTLGPGDKATIELTYDGGMLGHYVKQAAVMTNASETPYYLTMKGIVLAEVKDYSGSFPYTIGHLLADQNVLEFDNVNQGDQPQQVIHVMNNGTAEITPNVQHLPSYLTATASPERLRPGQAGQVIVTLDSKLLHGFGLTQTNVYLASRLGEKVQSETEVPVSIVALPDLKTFDGKNKQYAPRMELSADSVTLGLINGKMKKTAIITISNNGRTALDISSLQMFTSGLKITLGKRELQPGEHTKLKITVDREKLIKSKTRPRILMITNDPDKSKVIIPIHIK